jgi:hypothetical protein
MDRSGRCFLGELISAALLGLLVAGCKPTPEVVIPILKQKAVVVEHLNLFNHEPIGRSVKGNPWVAHIDAVDLDQDGLLDVIGCEAREGEVFWLRQTVAGKFEEITLATDMKGPVHVEALDMDHDRRSRFADCQYERNFPQQ